MEQGEVFFRDAPFSDTPGPSPDAQQDTPKNILSEVSQVVRVAGETPVPSALVVPEGVAGGEHVLSPIGGAKADEIENTPARNAPARECFTSLPL